MYCVRCGRQAPDGASFCARCGAPFARPSPTRQTSALTVESKPAQIGYSRAVAPWRLVVLAVATFGVYELIWIYRAWTFLRESTSSKPHCFLRTIGTLLPFLGIVFFFRLSDRIRSVTGVSYHAGWITAVFILANSLILTDTFVSPVYISWLGRPLGPLVSTVGSLLLTLAAAFALVPIQRALNGWWQSSRPGQPLRPRFTGGQSVALLVSGLVWLLFVAGTFSTR